MGREKGIRFQRPEYIQNAKKPFIKKKKKKTALQLLLQSQAYSKFVLLLLFFKTRNDKVQNSELNCYTKELRGHYIKEL